MEWSALWPAERYIGKAGVSESLRPDSELIHYPVPWDLLAALGPQLAKGTQTSVDEFTAAIVKRMKPPPLIEGAHYLPPTARFVLAANHYQRKGLWILHTAAALTQAIRQHYGPGDPPVRWVATANWPRVRFGPLSFRSPGDVLLPRVAHLWSCYPVSFQGTNPTYTAKSVRRILSDIPQGNRPLGLFPEGVNGVAGRIAAPIPGVARLLVHLAKKGVPVVPVGVSEAGRFVLRFGAPISTEQLEESADAGKFVIDRITQLALQ